MTDDTISKLNSMDNTIANSDEYYSQPWFHICDENFKIVEKSEDKPYGS